VVLDKPPCRGYRNVPAILACTIMTSAVADLTKDEWVSRVLGIALRPPASSSPDTAAPADIVGIWWDAKDQINEQLEALRTAILQTGHPLAARACDNGLGGFSGGVLTRFQAAVIDCRNANPEATGAARRNLEPYAASLADYVSSNKILTLLEHNPLGVRVTIRQKVTDAVNSILKHAAQL
jgi:hypothetical protein